MARSITPGLPSRLRPRRGSRRDRRPGRHGRRLQLVSVAQEDPASADARWCLGHYFAELGERFGEAWFANSDAGEWLSGIWAEGQRLDADELLAAKTGRPLDFIRADLIHGHPDAAGESRRGGEN